MKEGKFFLDTNILLYTFDKTAPHKRAIANDLVEQALTGKGLVAVTKKSYKVIQISSKSVSSSFFVMQNYALPTILAL